MELVVQEMWNICQFCLSQEEDLLTPVTSILDAHVTVENIERFTGIAITTDENIQQAVCTYCTDRLHEFSMFRRSCLRNDAYLRKIHPLVSAEESVDETGPVASSHSSKKSNHSSPTSKTSPQATVARSIKENNTATQDRNSLVNLPPPPLDCEINEEQYSANYIAPGEDLDDVEYATSDADDDFLMERNQNDEYRIEQEYIMNEMYHLLDLSKYERQPYLCELCGKQVSSIGSHLRFHTRRVYACPHCPAQMKHQANMARHIQAVHERRIVKTCKLCDKGFTHKNGHISHMLSHHGIGQRQQCRICGQEFNHKSSVREHINRHHNVQCYSCTLCDKTFTMKKALKVHQRVHSSEKPYSCPMCHKRFKSNEGRSSHLHTHYGFLFQCTLCDKTYRYKSQLNLHRRKMHPMESNE